MAVGAQTAVPKKGPKPPSEAPSDWLSPTNYGNPMSGALVKKRLLTLAFDDKEAVWSLPNTFAEVEEIARNWVQPPEGASFHLRIPAEYASVQASRLVHGPYLWLVNNETYEIAIEHMHVIRIEIVSDAPPPPDEPEAPPPPPPVFEMPCDFDLELRPGERVALGTICNSEDLDMSRSEDGTLVDGTFWGYLKITHTEDEHSMEFTGSRMTSPPSTVANSPQSVTSSMIAPRRPSTLKCAVRVTCPKEDTVEIGVCFSPMWALTGSFPPADPEENKAKWLVKVRPGGAIEHLRSSAVVGELFYEATPDTSRMALSQFVTPSNSFALPLHDFMLHIGKVLDSFGLPISARSSFLSSNYPSFSQYQTIAYRFMPPKAINRAIELFCTHKGSSIVWTRIFFMWRGLSDEAETEFLDAGKGEKAAMEKDWKSVVEWKEECRDPNMFGVWEVSSIECT